MAATTRVPHLQMWRLRRFFSPTDLAKKADVDRFTIYHAERGNPVRLATARKLAEALGVDPAQLCDETPEMAGANG